MTRLIVLEVADDASSATPIWESARDEDSGAIDVSGGVGRLLSIDAAGGAELVELRGRSATSVRARGPWPGPVAHHEIDWNGERLAVATWGSDFSKWIWGFDATSSAAWSEIAFSFDVGLAADPRTRETHVVLRDGADLVHATFGADGRSSASVVLTDIGSDGGVRVGWLAGTPEPLLVATPTRYDDTTYRATVQRFLPDGTAGFRLDFDAPTSSFAITDTPLSGATVGYGVAESGLRGRTLSFHGMVGDRTSSVVSMDDGCAGDPVYRQVQIAAGPCGYVVFCNDDGDLVRTFLVVPPAAE